jgi:hypothetical protein
MPIVVLSDLFLSLLVFGFAGWGAFFLAKRARVSVKPFLVSVAFLVPVGVLLYVAGSPFFQISDGIFYQAWGTAIAESWAGGPDAPIEGKWPGKVVWPTVIAIFTYLFGTVTVTLITLNACLFGFSVLVTQQSLRLLTGQDAPFWVSLFALTSTPFLIFGPSLLRESVYWLGASLGVLAVAHLRVRRFLPASLALIGSSLLVLAIRPDAGVVLVYSFVAAIAVLAGLSRTVFSNPAARLGAWAVIPALVVTVSPAVEFVRPGVEATTIVRSASALGDETARSAFTSPTGSFVGAGSPQPSTSPQPLCESFLVGQVVCKAFAHMPFALFGPFPWEYQASPIWIVAGFSTMHFLLLSFFALFYVLRPSTFDWAGLLIIGVAAVSMVLFASVLTNYGILIRFRATVEIILLPLAVAGFMGFREVLNRRRAETP